MQNQNDDYLLDTISFQLSRIGYMQEMYGVSSFSPAIPNDFVTVSQTEFQELKELKKLKEATVIKIANVTKLQAELNTALKNTETVKKQLTAFENLATTDALVSKTKLNAARSAVNAAEVATNKIKQKLDIAKQLVTNANAEIKRLKIEVVDVNTANDGLKKELADKTTELETSKKNFEELNIKSTALEYQCAISLETINDLVENIYARENQKKIVENDIKNLFEVIKNNMDSRKEEYENNKLLASQNINHLNYTVGMLEGHIKKLQDELDEKIKKAGNYEFMIKALKANHAKEIEKYKNLQNTLHKTYKQIRILTLKIAEQTTTITTLENTIGQVQVENEELQEKITAANLSSADLQAQMIGLTDEKNVLVAQYNQLLQNYNDTERANADIGNQLVILEYAISNKENQIGKLREELDAANQKNIQLSDVNIKITRERDAARTNKITAERERNAATATIAAKNQQILEADAQRNAAQTNKAAAEAQRNAAQTNKAAAEAERNVARAESNAKNQQIAEAVEQRNAEQASKAAAEAERNAAIRESTAKNQQIRDAAAELLLAQTNKAAAEVERNQARVESVAKNQQIQAVNAERIADIAAKNQQIRDVEAQRNVAQASKAAAEVERNAARDSKVAAEAQRIAATVERNAAIAQRNQAMTDSAAKNQQILAVNAERNAAQAERNQARAERNAATAASAIKNQQIQEAVAQRNAATATIAAKNQEIQDADARLIAKDRELIAAQGQVAQVIENINRITLENQTLRNRVTFLENQIRENTAQFNEAVQLNRQQNGNIERLQKEKIDLIEEHTRQQQEIAANVKTSKSLFSNCVVLYKTVAQILNSFNKQKTHEQQKWLELKLVKLIKLGMKIYDTLDRNYIIKLMAADKIAYRAKEIESFISTKTSLKNINDSFAEDVGRWEAIRARRSRDIAARGAYDPPPYVLAGIPRNGGSNKKNYMKYLKYKTKYLGLKKFIN